MRLVVRLSLMKVFFGNNPRYEHRKLVGRGNPLHKLKVKQSAETARDKLRVEFPA